MNSEKYEVEVKIAVHDPLIIETSLIKLGAKKTKIESQTDAYFNHPSRDFEVTDEALRIRLIEGIPLEADSASAPVQETEVTYKGPKIDSTTKTRLELSLGIDDIDTATAILEQLGFRSVAKIRKRRSFFLFDDTVISIDDVEHVGTFLELERVVDSMELIPSARALIFSQLEKLGIMQSESIRNSYLELFLRKLHS
ncbi:MAG: class IV adenylate cyclase [Candidatus Thorarchaeota archaeon]|nr:class IV adenylate cyclase [Candidatus Thorarchaeota archaeon]